MNVSAAVAVPPVPTTAGAPVARAENGARGADDGNATAEGTEGRGATTAETALSARELQELHSLKRRDQEVRAHEMAHQAAGGRYVRGGAQFVYQRGPDGTLYAVGGEVDIDTARVPGDPAATLDKAQAVRRAALAPAEPSAQDLRVAAAASQDALQARVELAAEAAEAASEKGIARSAGEPDGPAQDDATAPSAPKLDLYA